MQPKALLIDLDDTLYARSSGLWPAIKDRISLYMIEKMGMPAVTVPVTRKHLFETYGTTLRGLKVVYDIDEMEYLSYVHDVKLAEYLKRDDCLRGILNSYQQRKIIFTNADRKHADRVIDVLGLNGVFDTIIDILEIWPYCKPQKESFDIVLRRTNMAAHEMVFIDDSLANILSAKALGFGTVLISENGNAPDGIAAIDSLHLLPSVITPIGQ